MADQGPIRAGLAYVELMLKNKLGSGLDKAAAQLKAFGAAVTKIGLGMIKLGGLILAPFSLAAKIFADTGSSLLDLSQKTGASVEALSALSYAAEQSGSNLEDIGKAYIFMSKALVEAQDNASSVASIFDDLGISVKKLNELSQDERFIKIAEAISRVEDPARRASLALALFGKGGTALLPMLAGGMDGVKDLMAEAQRLGVVMSTADAEAAEAFGDSISRVGTMLKGFAVQIGGVVAPAVKMLTDWLADSAQAIRSFLQNNEVMIRVIFTAGVAFVALGVAVMALGGVFSTIGTAVGMLVGVFAVLKTIIVAIFSPAAALVVAIGLIGYSLSDSATKGVSAITWLGEQFASLFDLFSDIWSGITDAIAAGDLALAFQVAWAGATVIWAEALAGLQGTLATFLEKFTSGWSRVTRFVADVWDTVVSDLSRGLRKVVEFFGWLWDRITFRTNEGWAHMASRVEKAVAEMEKNEARLAAVRDASRRREDAERHRQSQDWAGVPAANERAAAARQEFQGLRAQAAWQHWLADFEREMASWSRPDRGGITGLGRAKGELTAGTFSSQALSGLGMGSTQERIRVATEETARNTRSWLENLDENGLAFQ